MTPQLAQRQRGHIHGTLSRVAASRGGFLFPLARSVEVAVWGGEFRERLLIALLRRHYESLFRRQWVLASTPPHYFDHRIGSFAFATGTADPFAYYRGFFAAEMIRDGSVLLDIGCGDGFFVRRFFAPKCARVDAIDIDADAIEHATRKNSAANIRYYRADAVNEPFPDESYDVIVMDGSLGHFDPSVTRRLLGKIRAALTSEGVFVGSESLGTEGHDHLQFFDTLADLGAILGEYFEHVQLRSIHYVIPSGAHREEAYWRCAQQRAPLDQASWQTHAGSPGSGAK